MACGRSGYLGAVRLEDGRIDFAAAIDADTLKRAGGVFEAASEIAEEAGVAEAWPLDEVAHWRATPALTRRRRRLAAPGLFVIGDAAGYVEPFTGEGMAWALAGGAAVAPLAIAASRQWDPQHPRLWADRHRRAVRRRQLGCRAVAATLRRPRLTAAVVRTLAACPPLVRPLTARLNRPSSVMVRSSSTRPAVQDVPLSGAA
jgi:flavin-dependent dehydrogenase